MSDQNVSSDQTAAIHEALDAVGRERARQIEQEGYSTEHDDEHTKGELAAAAAVYALPPAYRQLRVLNADLGSALWPWVPGYKSTSYHDLSGRLRELEKAGALILAEIERLRRVEARRKVAMAEAGYVELPKGSGAS